MTASPERGRWPWPPGSATGVGSLPGTDPTRAMHMVVELLPDFPHLPELAARGPWADLTGRGMALLPGMTGDVGVSGWRLVPRPGRDVSLARSMLNQDLDALEEGLAGFRGAVKIQVVGPVTLAATVELPSGHAAVSDPGARRDLAQSLAEGLAEHAGEVRRRVPGARLVVQLDEPSLPTCLAGELPTASGFSRIRALPGDEAQRWLAMVIAAVGDAVPLIHCCDARVPVARLVAAGARALSLDLAAVGVDADDDLGAALESGAGLVAGVVATAGSAGSDPGATVTPVWNLWRRLGLPAERLSAQVVVSPTCGLAGSTPQGARAAYQSAVRGARLLDDDPEGRR